MNRAQDWNAFRSAAALFDVPAQNIVYADVDGNIGYQAPGAIPVRLAGDGTVPLPGWVSTNGWSGRVPFDQLPSSFNPPRGYIVTANNAVSTGGPALTQDWDLGYRADGIERMLQEHLAAGEKVTADDLARMQLDTSDASAGTLLPVIAELPLEGDAARGAALLAGWDGRAEVDSAQAAYFAVFWRNLLDGMFAIAPRADASDGRRPLVRGRGLAARRARRDLVDERVAPGSPAATPCSPHALEAAWSEASELMGDDPDDWRWGRLHTLTLTNESFGESGIGPIEWLFNRGPYELGGGSAIVNAIGWDARLGYGVDWVPSMRMIVDLHDLDASRWVNLTGASGHAFHPNYADQAPLWQAGETRAWPFTADAVREAARDMLPT